MGFFENIQEKTQQLKEKTQNSRQKLKVSAKSKTRFAENASKEKAWYLGFELMYVGISCITYKMLQRPRSIQLIQVHIGTATHSA